MIIYVFKKHEILLKTMKIVEFFIIIWGKFSELEPELEPDKNGPAPQHWVPAPVVLFLYLNVWPHKAKYLMIFFFVAEYTVVLFSCVVPRMLKLCHLVSQLNFATQKICMAIGHGFVTFS
jgi:hypothetical protein